MVAGAGGFLAVGEGWEFEVEEVAEGGGVLFEGVLGGFLEGGPAGPGVLRGVVDVAELAEPLDVGAGEVAFLDAAAEVSGAWAVGVEHGVEDFGGAVAIVEGEAVFEVAVMIDEAVGGAAGGAEALGGGGGGEVEFDTGAEVGEVDDEFVDGVGFVFEGGDDGEAFAALEEGEDFAALGGVALLVDEAELTPGVDGGAGAGGAGDWGVVRGEGRVGFGAAGQGALVGFDDEVVEGVFDGEGGQWGEVEAGVEEGIALVEFDELGLAFEFELGDLGEQGGGDGGEVVVFDVGEAEVFFSAWEFEEFAQRFGGAEGLGLVGVDGAEGEFDAEAAGGVFVGLFEAEDAAKASGETSGEGAEGEGGDDAFGGGEPAIGEGCFLRGVAGAALPFASGVEELFFVAFESEEGGGGGLVRGGGVGACREVFEAEGRGDFGVETGGEGFGGGEGVFAGGGGVFHDAEEEGPGEDAAAMEAGGAGVGEAGALSGGDDAAAFVEAATTGATEHLEEFV